MDKNSFVFYTDWKKPLAMLSAEDQSRVLMAMIDYQNGETADLSDSPAAEMAFEFIRLKMDEDRGKWEDTCRRRAEAAKRAAETRWNSDSETKDGDAKEGEGTRADAKECGTMPLNAKACERMRTHKEDAKDAPNADSDSDSDSDGDGDGEDERKEKDPLRGSKEKAPPRHRYGHYRNVLLNDRELKAVKEEFPDWESRVERLSEYMASSGKSYKSHLATIRSWAKKDRARGEPTERSYRGGQDVSALYDDEIYEVR